MVHAKVDKLSRKYANVVRDDPMVMIRVEGHDPTGSSMFPLGDPPLELLHLDDVISNHELIQFIVEFKISLLTGAKTAFRRTWENEGSIKPMGEVRELDKMDPGFRFLFSDSKGKKEAAG